jgi:hypothetical protein
MECLTHTQLSVFLETHVPASLGDVSGRFLIREGATGTTEEVRPARCSINEALAKSCDGRITNLAKMRWCVTRRVLLIVQEVEQRQVLVGMAVLEEAEDITEGVEGYKKQRKHASLELLDTVALFQPGKLRRQLALQLVRMVALYYRRKGFVSLRWHACAPGAGVQYLLWGQAEDRREDSVRRQHLQGFYVQALGLLPLCAYYGRNQTEPDGAMSDHQRLELHGTVRLTSPPLHHLVLDKFEIFMAEKLADVSDDAPLTAAVIQEMETACSKRAADSISYGTGDDSFLIDLQQVKEGQELQAQRDDALQMHSEGLPVRSDAAFQELLLCTTNLLKMLEVSTQQSLTSITMPLY